MSEDELQKLESEFPALSGQAFSEAFHRVQASGQSVMYSRDGIIYMIHPNGQTEKIKKCAPPFKIPSGTVYNF